ncbi:MAG: Flp pilus assembly complex ATPase component TadA [Candidatus Omnitrophica bacterium]|nr:Flp pilus assembly complex ATPase component TadA [Candidatus Omnitrophota bacterium]
MPRKLDTVLSEALIEQKLITKEELERFLKEAESLDLTLQQVLMKHNRLKEKDILRILAERLGIAYLDLRELSVDKTVIDKVPVKIASYYKFLPVQIKDRVMTIAVSYPLDVRTQDEIRTQLGYDIEIALSCQDDISEALKRYYGLAADTLEKIVSSASQVMETPLETTRQKVEDIERLAEDASVIKLVNQIILDAYRKRATDIHIEPYRQGLSIRYRIDGLLYESPVPAEIRNFLSAIISRIKIMSNLNIVERRLPQDGSAVVKVQDQMLDLRISTIPTPYGESVVIRILPTKMLFSLEKLGLSKRDLQIFEELIQRPHGIIFVTGPTGSGKTTTLYACLSRINTKDRKIITIEDPIEYDLPGVTQIQVMPEIGLDFARGLRSILRHDPDIIMVGEVRDLETAEIAIRVALTGHLVFSTLHTNDAPSGITRLIDIGLEPYLVSSSVEAFIAQRLIRLICLDCRYEDTSAPIELKEMIAKDLGLKSIDAVKISRGKGCPSCNFTGFFGRTAIYEILLLDGAIRDLILKKTPSGQIKRLALSRGMHTLRQDGWQKVIAGLTTPEEVMRVTSAEESVLESKYSIFQMPSFWEPQQTSPLSEQDRRSYLRLNTKINMKYKIFKSVQDLTQQGFQPEQLSVTKNISAAGLLFISDEPIALASVLELNIELPDGKEPIQCLARVVRIEEINNRYDVGVCFLDITAADKARLNKYVESTS